MYNQKLAIQIINALNSAQLWRTAMNKERKGSRKYVEYREGIVRQHKIMEILKRVYA